MLDQFPVREDFFIVNKVGSAGLDPRPNRFLTNFEGEPVWSTDINAAYKFKTQKQAANKILELQNDNCYSVL